MLQTVTEKTFDSKYGELLVSEYFCSPEDIFDILLFSGIHVSYLCFETQFLLIIDCILIFRKKNHKTFYPYKTSYITYILLKVKE